MKESNVLAITTSTAEERHYATYCGPDEVVGPEIHLKVCMSNLASALLFRQLEKADFAQMTWRQIVETVDNDLEK